MNIDKLPEHKKTLYFLIIPYVLAILTAFIINGLR